MAQEFRRRNQHLRLQAAERSCDSAANPLLSSRRKKTAMRRIRAGNRVVATMFAVLVAVQYTTSAFAPQRQYLAGTRSHAAASRFGSTSSIAPIASRTFHFLPTTRQPSSSTASRTSNILARSSKSEEVSSSSSSSSPRHKTTTEIPGLDPAISAAVTGNPPLSVTLDDGSKYSYNEAIQRTLGWVGAAITFGGGVWAISGAQTGEEFFAGYLVEQSLSVDNLFVFLLLFEYFKVPLQYQDRVLNWGIYGAVVMRAVMIGLGAAALQQFHAILLVFAAILVYSSAKFFVGAGDGGDDEEDPSNNSIVKFSHSLIDSTEHFDGDRFFTVVDGIRKATPLFICMIAVEISDVVFAVDSIPAVFGVTENPLVVFSSNLFAIMGLRSLYTILSKAATDLKYLEPAVALVLGFIGAKMIAEYFGIIVPTNLALAVVATVLGSGVGLSVLDKQKMLEEEDFVPLEEDAK